VRPTPLFWCLLAAAVFYAGIAAIVVAVLR
jgi:hypothetical protein